MPADDHTTTSTGGSTTSTTSRYAEDLTGNLGADINADGSATLPLATVHGDIATTVAIPAGTDENTAATSCTGWSDYTEYGTPHDQTATDAVAGTVGYGWLGAKQRSTTPEAAGLTLMGDRLYNPVRGQFTAPDPIEGGNTTAYTYPQDPINRSDVTGQCWGPSWICNVARKTWHAARAVINVPSTAIGLAYAYIRGGRCSAARELTFNCEGVHGANGAGGYTIGNVWLHQQRNRDYDPRDLRHRMRHERRHSDQYAIFGGFVGFPALYGIDRLVHHNPRKSWFERWAGLRDGDY